LVKPGCIEALIRYKNLPKTARDLPLKMTNGFFLLKTNGSLADNVTQKTRFSQVAHDLNKGLCTKSATT
jgi:hypothetical protein